MFGRWNRWGGFAVGVLLGVGLALPHGPAAAQGPQGPDAQGAAAFQGAEFRARLRGFEEVPPISTRARGQFRAQVAGGVLHYELTYGNVEGGAVLFAHIHFGQRDVNGGVVAFLCGGGGKPACPQFGTVTGTITPADIREVASQGIAAGDFVEVLRAMRAGVTYANVHSTMFPAGEIRGQIRRSDSVSAPDDRDVE